MLKFYLDTTANMRLYKLSRHLSVSLRNYSPSFFYSPETIGIDLGTTNSVVAFKDTNVRVISTGPNNEDLCRSCVAVDPSGSFVVGNAVYKNWRRYAPNIVVSVKRLMGASINDPQVQKMKSDKDMYPYGISKLSGRSSERSSLELGRKKRIKGERDPDAGTDGEPGRDTRCVSSV